MPYRPSDSANQGLNVDPSASGGVAGSGREEIVDVEMARARHVLDFTGEVLETGRHRSAVGPVDQLDRVNDGLADFPFQMLEAGERSRRDDIGLCTADFLSRLTAKRVRDFTFPIRESSLAPATDLPRRGIDARSFLMVGNSLRSDVLPVIALGGQAVYIPAEVTWAHEAVDAPGPEAGGYHQLAHMGLLPALVEQLIRQERP